MATTTKFPLMIAACAAAMFTFSNPASAQVKVEKPKIEITIQETPRFNPETNDDKRDTQLYWIEVEVEFEADERGGKPGAEYIDALEFKYFITVKPRDPKDRKVYTLTVDHINIPKGEKTYSVAYMAPVTVGTIIGKDARPTKADIDVAVEVRHNGTLIAGDATKDPKKKWWNSIPNVDGLVLPKGKTPFAVLWYDRYAQSKE